MKNEKDKLRALMSEMFAKVSVGAQFEKRAEPIPFDINEDWAEYVDELGTGKVEWRALFIDKERGIVCVHNRWDKHSSMAAHMHPDSDEYLHVIDGTLSIITYKNDGSILDSTILKPDTPSYHIPAGVMHYAYSTDQATQFVVRFKKVWI